MLTKPLPKVVIALLLLCAPVQIAAAKLFSKPQVGYASFYGRRHQGRLMSNGHRFDRKRFTAASRRFGLGTMCRVTALATHKSVIVEITDRGPYRKGRIIDLSEAAAGALGLLRRGIGLVKVEPVRPLKSRRK
jgi:rare lipoprotein A